jgi:hypothetical protein
MPLTFAGRDFDGDLGNDLFEGSRKSMDCFQTTNTAVIQAMLWGSIVGKS